MTEMNAISNDNQLLPGGNDGETLYSDLVDPEAAGLLPMQRTTSKGMISIQEANMKAIESRQNRVHRRVNAPRGAADANFEDEDLYGGGVYERNGTHHAI